MVLGRRSFERRLERASRREAAWENGPAERVSEGLSMSGENVSVHEESKMLLGQTALI
jgi:hypothetical protein